MNNPPIYGKGTYDQLKVELEKEFDVEISDFEKVNIGYSNEVFSAKIDDKQTIIRIGKGKHTYLMEVTVYNELANRGIPVPKIYFHKENPTNIEQPIMITQKFTDNTLGNIELDAGTEKRLYKKAGKILKKIHEYKVEGFGDLALKGNALEGKYNSSKEFWAARSKKHNIYEYLESLRTNNLVDQSRYELILQSFSDICELQCNNSVFVHGDFHQAHIFTDHKEITGVIDISNGFAGDLRYDVAYTLFFLDPRQKEAFLDGYDIAFPDEIIIKYLIFIAGEKISWRHKKGNLEGVQEAKNVLNSTIGTYTNRIYN